MNISPVRSYGWRRPAVRVHAIEHSAKLTTAAAAALPDAVDLRSLCPDIYDQGSLGSCTANALAFAIEFLLLRQQRANIPTPLGPLRPSRLAIYFDERVMEGTVPTDAGAVIGDGVHVLATEGWIRESDWPYDVTKFAEPPGGYCTTDRLADFTSLPHDIDAIRGKLAMGFPVVFGVQVYSQIETAPGGAVALPTGGTSIGGHALALVGYDHARRVFLLRNSWGTAWGQAGYGTIPYDYVTSLLLCDEVYSLEAVRP